MTNGSSSVNTIHFGQIAMSSPPFKSSAFLSLVLVVISSGAELGRSRDTMKKSM
jgi:hypothetical protein